MLSVVIDTTLFLQNLLLGDIPPEYDKVSPTSSRLIHQKLVKQ